MLAELVVIASNSGANSELIENNKTGLLYKLGDYKDLADKIEFLINNKDKMKEISKRAKAYALSNYTSDINTKNIYDLYLSLMKKANKIKIK